jgi:hypothetical protein
MFASFFYVDLFCLLVASCLVVSCSLGLPVSVCIVSVEMSQVLGFEIIFLMSEH